MTLKYYDACLFGNASNGASADHDGCVKATTVANINWAIACCSEIVLSEFPSVTEFFNQFFVYCALSGVARIDVTLAEAKATAKLHRHHKNPMRQLGFDGNDWNHLMAAVHACSDEIITTDEDFFDPSNKSNRGAARKVRKVADYIKGNFDIDIKRP